MKIDMTKDWCIAMAQLEAEAESDIGAGELALDPSFDGIKADVLVDESRIAFGRFVSLMRRHRGLSAESLAEDADIDLAEIVSIEDNPHFTPEARTVYQLANYMEISASRLMELSGLMQPKNDALYQEAVRFAARSEPITALTPEEHAALEGFISVLSED